ncbi:MAG: nitrous oxide reductase family maturation protein NosD [Phycisphaerales bacterium]
MRIFHPSQLATLVAMTCLMRAATASADGFDLQKQINAATPGRVIRVPAGVHAGTFIIDKPLTLIGDDGAIIDGMHKRDVILIQAPNVTLRHLTIRNSGDSLDHEDAGVKVLAKSEHTLIEDCRLQNVLFGIYMKEAPDGIVRRNTITGMKLDIARRGDAIRLWSSPNALLQGNTIHDARDVVIWFSGKVRIIGNTIRYGRYGLHFMYSDDNQLIDNTLEGNSVGAYLMFSQRLVVRGNTFFANRGPSGYGMGLKDLDGIIATDNRFLGNRIGIYLDNSPQSVDVFDTFDQNIIAYNDIGIAFMPAVHRNRFTRNVFLENVEQIAVLGQGQLTGNEFSVAGVGNFWSDYLGYDRDNDGQGDVPYRSVSLFENLMDRQPKLRFFLYSPAEQAINLAARAMPTFQPPPKITDDHPLMRPPAFAVASTDYASGLPYLAVAGLLAAMAGSVVIIALRFSTSDIRFSRDSIGRNLPMSSTISPLLQVGGLTKRFGKRNAVDDVNFTLDRGRVLALWGSNGAGKTTALRCIIGLYDHQGDVQINGLSMRRNGKAARQLIGYVPQELSLYDDWRLRPLLRFFAAIKRAPKSRIDIVLQQVGLSEHDHKRVSELSGGMKRRLGLAIALLADSPLLVLDEFTANLDAAARQDLVNLLRHEKQRGRSILFTSHRLEEVESLADEILVLEAGRMLTTCSPGELATKLGLRTTVRLIVDADQMAQAAQVLIAQGFDAARNCTAVRVRVTADAKAAPIHALTAAGIRVRSFELEDGDRISDSTAQGIEL